MRANDYLITLRQMHGRYMIIPSFSIFGDICNEIMGLSVIRKSVIIIKYFGLAKSKKAEPVIMSLLRR